MSTPALPEISEDDLKDPTLGKLNRNFQRAWGQIISLSGGAGPVSLSALLTAPDIQLPSQTSPPINKDSVLTLRSGLTLFSPTSQRQALVSGAFQTSSTNVQTSQPIGAVGGGFSGTIVGTFTVGGVAKTMLVFTGGVLTDVQ
jgi:hypothetical protein